MLRDWQGVVIWPNQAATGASDSEAFPPNININYMCKYNQSLMRQTHAGRVDKMAAVLGRTPLRKSVPQS